MNYENSKQYKKSKSSSLKILALDTSTNNCSVAISSNNVIYTENIVEAKIQAKIILQLIDDDLQESN
mgnify:FL=1